MSFERHHLRTLEGYVPGIQPRSPAVKPIRTKIPIRRALRFVRSSHHYRPTFFGAIRIRSRNAFG
jgi:hypothetical protein